MPVDRLLHPRLLNSRKICELSHFEYRVWQTYVLIADDFGVMPMDEGQIMVSPVFKRDRPRTISAALVKFVDLHLVAKFDDDAQPFIWTPTWQYHQRIRYPRREETYFPPPPEAELKALDDRKTSPTRRLFATFHLQVSEAFRQQFGDPDELLKIAARQARKRGGPGGSHSGNASETDPEGSAPRGYARDAGAQNGVYVPANGQGPTVEADGQRPTAGGGVGEPAPLDVWLRDLQAKYPTRGVTSGYLTEHAFFKAITGDGRAPREVFDEMLANLANQIAGAQWARGMVPSLQNWLSGGKWKQQHDPAPNPNISGQTQRNIDGLAEAKRFVTEGRFGVN